MAERHFDVVLPDEVLTELGWEESDLSHRITEVLVTQLVQFERISAGRAAELLGVSRWDINELMSRYGVPSIRMSPEELKVELSKEISGNGLA